MQQIDAKRAMAFVRQRRDTSDPNYQFSDVDRERRQQAFIAPVSHQDQATVKELLTPAQPVASTTPAAAAPTAASSQTPPATEAANQPPRRHLRTNTHADSTGSLQGGAILCVR